MNLDHELESGIAPRKSARAGSVLYRLASAVARALEPHAPAHHPSPDPVTSKPETLDPEKGSYSKAENEEACAKAWSVYVGEAERYDASLVESWKADMEGMLIFSGLFSASLTAFIIESYKVLQPDSGDLTVAAITQVSQQLAAIASNQVFVLPPPVSFNPTTASLWCNVLWFISLSLSLTCALLATLVEQWAREFLHKTEMRPSPVRRARVFSFLYFGLKRFRMHTIVDTIPFLLHASLLLFFAGLIAFLLPVNHIMMYLMGIALVTFFLLYTALTVLPVVRLDCPYRTPLSAPLWSLLQCVVGFFSTDSSWKRTITEAVVNSALRDTQSRDQRALEWTLESLTDDIELLPFVEAIPDMIHGPNGFRRINDPLFERILGTTDVASPLVTRICSLIASTQGMAVDDPLRIRRCTAGQKAIWALCMMPCAWDRYFAIDTALFDGHMGGLPLTALLAVRYQAQQWSHHLLRTLRNLLVTHDHSSQNFLTGVLPTAWRLLRLVLDHHNLIASPFPGILVSSPNACFVHLAELKDVYAETEGSIPTASQLDKARCAAVALYDSHDWAHHSLIFLAAFVGDGLGSSFRNTDPLFEPIRTCYAILSEIEGNPSTQIITEAPPIGIGFHLHGIDMGTFKFAEHNPHALDILAQITLRLSSRIPMYYWDVATYLDRRHNDAAIRYALYGCDLTKLARALGDSLLDSIERDTLKTNTLIRSITAVAGCVYSDSVAIQFVDVVLAGRSLDFLPQHSAIRAVRNFRSLGQVFCKILGVERLPEPDRIPCLQEICDDDIFRPFSPLFLPKEADVMVVIDSLQIQLIDKYIEFLTNFFQNVIPATARLKIPALDPLFIVGVSHWKVADQAIQKDFFAAILAYTKSPELHSHSGWAAIETKLWACNLFWVHPFHGNPILALDGIEPACLQLLREALERYHAAADAWLEHAEFEDKVRVPMDTTSSKRLLAAVDKELSDYASTSDASSIDTGEMQHLYGKEGSLRLEGEAEDVDEK